MTVKRQYSKRKYLRLPEKVEQQVRAASAVLHEFLSLEIMGVENEITTRESQVRGLKNYQNRLERMRKDIYPPTK